jgi:hypothetical protein
MASGEEPSFQISVKKNGGLELVNCLHEGLA